MKESVAAFFTLIGKEWDSDKAVGIAALDNHQGPTCDQVFWVTIRDRWFPHSPEEC